MESAQAWAHLESLYGEEVSMLSQAPQPSKTCTVFLQNQPSVSATITIDTWVSENYLIWSLLASLADSNTPGFTTTFNRHYRPIWNDIQSMVASVTPAERSLLYINPPPFERAVFVFTTPGLDQDLGFVIKSTLYNTRPHNDLLDLLDYLHYAQLSEDIKLYVSLSEDGENSFNIFGDFETTGSK